MAKGVVVEFLHRKVTFYPLTIGQIQDLQEELKALMGVAKGDDPFAPARFDKLKKIYGASARRGNPAITDGEIAELVDLGNIQEVNSAVLGQSGLVPEEEAGAGPTSPPTGGASTPR